VASSLPPSKIEFSAAIAELALTSRAATAVDSMVYFIALLSLVDEQFCL
jgi:hypothetical protein